MPMVFDSGGVAGAGGGVNCRETACGTCHGPLSASRRCMNPDCPRFVGEPHVYPVCGTGNPKTGFTCDLPDKHIGLHRDDKGPFSTPDKINHPQHYTSDPSGVECITIVEHRNFNVGNAIKYLWRAGLKEGQATDDDLRKAIWYIERERQRLKVAK
jgi:hypothetical protein